MLVHCSYEKKILLKPNITQFYVIISESIWLDWSNIDAPNTPDT
jgi:hypothetical protein